MRRSDHPSRPSAITCCRFSALKTLAIPAAGVQPTAQVNVSAPGAALAGFQVSINGRFWVSTEDRRHPLGGPQVGGIAMGAGPAREQPRQALALPCRQLRRPASRGLRCQARASSPPKRIPPPPDGAHRSTHHPRHGPQRVAALQEPHCPPPPPLQLRRRPLRSHGPSIPETAANIYYLCNAQ